MPEFIGTLTIEFKLNIEPASPPPSPPPPPPVPPPMPKLFEGFELIESFKYPTTSVEGTTTAFGPGCLAGRKMYGNMYFVMDCHLGAHGELWVSTLKTVEGDGRYICKLFSIGRPFGDVVPNLPGWTVTGLMFVGDSMYFTFGKSYNTDQKAESFAGVVEFVKDSWIVKSVRLLPSVGNNLNNLWARGGVTQATDGTILVGFGGYYSIIAGGSFGPCLVDPNSRRVWLGYRDPKKAIRPGDYIPVFSDGDWLAPESGEHWAASDEIGGEDHSSFCLWIDDKVIFSTYQGIGKIGYDGSVTAESRVNRLYVYNAQDIYDVRDGDKNAWDPVPEVIDFAPPPGCEPSARMAGGHYDRETGEVWIVWVNAWVSGPELYPILARYRVTTLSPKEPR